MLQRVNGAGGAPPEDARMDERFRGSVSHAYQAFHGELLRFLRKHLAVRRTPPTSPRILSPSG